jgi:hypothetical protein
MKGDFTAFQKTKLLLNFLVDKFFHGVKVSSNPLFYYASLLVFPRRQERRDFNSALALRNQFSSRGKEMDHELLIEEGKIDNPLAAGASGRLGGRLDRALRQRGQRPDRVH